PDRGSRIADGEGMAWGQEEPGHPERRENRAHETGAASSEPPRGEDRDEGKQLRQVLAQPTGKAGQQEGERAKRDRLRISKPSWTFQIRVTNHFRVPLSGASPGLRFHGVPRFFAIPGPVGRPTVRVCRSPCSRVS